MSVGGDHELIMVCGSEALICSCAAPASASGRDTEPQDLQTQEPRPVIYQPGSWALLWCGAASSTLRWITELLGPRPDAL